MTTGPINFATARSVASRVNGREPFSSSYLLASCERDLVEVSAQAVELVTRETGLALTSEDRTRVVTRDEWVAMNLRNFERMLDPVLSRIAERSDGKTSVIGRNLTGAQLGTVLGWVSTRVLGQYDFTLPNDKHPEQHDFVYYVAPNVLALEKKFAFPPRQFRLWLAVHELTHRAQFTGVPWMTAHFEGLVSELVGMMDEPTVLAESIKRAATDIRKKGESTKDAGLMGAFASPQQQALMTRIGGLMALLEGHAEVTMNRAAAEAIPDAARFHRVLHERRTKAGVSKLIQKALGMDAKLRQYAEGRRFIEEVERTTGRDGFLRVWEAPENLPTSAEIRSPELWIARMESPHDADVPAG